MKKIVQVVFILLCVVGAGFFLAGCKQSTIQFYRESKASQLMKDLNNQNNSSGVIKLDNSSSGSDGIKFGPKDINFGSSN